MIEIRIEIWGGFYMQRKIFVLLLVLCMIFVASGCKLLNRDKNSDSEAPVEKAVEQVQSNMRRTVLYFVNENSLLVPIAKEIPWVEGIGKAALESLVTSPETELELSTQGLKPSLPADTKVLGMTIRDGIAKVDLSSEFLNLPDKASEKNAIDSVVYTLTEFSAIDKVQLMVEGKPLKECPNGTAVESVLYREKINLENASSDIVKNDMIPVTLYFKSTDKSGNYSYFVPVTRMVKVSDNVIKTAVEELVKGPAEDMGLASILPHDAKVLDVKQDASEVVVNFSKDLLGYGGGTDVEQSLVNSIVLTVSQFPGVEQVSILVEGKKEVLPEGTILDSPISSPIYVNTENI